MSYNIKKIIKRNGEVVDFNQEKIKIAMRKAFQEVLGSITENELEMLVEHIVIHLSYKYKDSPKNPHVEDVQDTVERVLMEKGYYNVAKVYIVYRYEHSKIREEKKKDIQEKIDQEALYIVKRSGERQIFSMEKLKKSILFASNGLGDDVNVDLIAKNCRAEVYDGITTKDLERVLIMSSRSLIERDPAYSKLTARLLSRKLYREVIGFEFDYEKLDKQYRRAFIDNIQKGINLKRLDDRLLGFDLELLGGKLALDRDLLFDYLGLQVLYDRYFIQNPASHEILEIPQAFWMRVAMGLALNEKDKNQKAIEFYEIMSTLRYIPSTPTLFHAGTPHPQLSSCYLTTVQDSLTHIFKSIADNAQLSKWSGGIGNDWTNIRGTGSFINGTGVESQGVIPFLKIANDTTVAINRSGRRRGATCAYLEAWHYDIEDFLELRKNTGDERRRTHDMDTAIWIPDLLMKRVREDGDWTLFSSEAVSDLHDLYGRAFEERYFHYESEARAGKMRLFKTIRAKDFWRKILSMLFETGHPWITWKDPCNLRSPQDHVGVVHSSNLCTEITLNTSEEEVAVCNLGSLNLRMHVKNGKFDAEMVKETVRVAMRMLDNVVDINFYPIKEARISNLKHRPVGLGIMGFQDALFMLNINFNSKEAIDFADSSMETIAYHAYWASTELAEEKGAYESFKGSKWDRGILPLDTIDLLERERGVRVSVSRTSRLDWNALRERIKKFGMRNSNSLACAPTATISNIAGSFPTIEPIYTNLYVKSNMSGEFVVVNDYLVEDLKKLNLWNASMLEAIKRTDGDLDPIDTIPQNLKEKYKGVFFIPYRHLIDVSAVRGKWIDQSQSLNMFYSGTSGRDLSDMYMYAWECGLKTTYYLRSMGASHVEKSTVKLNTSSTSEAIKNAVTVESVVVESVSISGDSLDSIVESVEVSVGDKICRLDDPHCEACQ